jgi:hypothetical protein
MKQHFYSFGCLPSLVVPLCLRSSCASVCFCVVVQVGASARNNAGMKLLRCLSSPHPKYGVFCFYGAPMPEEKRASKHIAMCNTHRSPDNDTHQATRSTLRTTHNTPHMQCAMQRTRRTTPITPHNTQECTTICAQHTTCNTQRTTPVTPHSAQEYTTHNVQHATTHTTGFPHITPNAQPTHNTRTTQHNTTRTQPTPDSCRILGRRRYFAHRCEAMQEVVL